MNAYELADQVEMWGEDLLALNMKGGIPVVQGAKMLRQQADRIAELEKLLVHQVGADCREMRYIQEIENKDARIAELEKALDWIATVNAMDYEYQDVAKSLLKERHGIK